MALEDDVGTFLNDFRQKARIYEIYFYPRGKNTDAILQLGISAKKREEIIISLAIENYYRGPTGDISPDRPEYYEFGTLINGQEIYIKLSLGKFNRSPHCMSFHIAEHRLNYPLRK